MTKILKSFGVFMLAALAVLIVAAVLGLILYGAQPTADLEDILTPYRWWLLAWRIGLIAGLMVFWPYVISLLGKRKQFSSEMHRRLMKLRWKVGAGLIVFDLLLIQKIISF